MEINACIYVNIHVHHAYNYTIHMQLTIVTNFIIHIVHLFIAIVFILTSTCISINTKKKTKTKDDKCLFLC